MPQPTPRVSTAARKRTGSTVATETSQSPRHLVLGEFFGWLGMSEQE